MDRRECLPCWFETCDADALNITSLTKAANSQISTIVGNLMAFPTLLPFSILTYLGCLTRRQSMSNRCGMLFAIFLMAFFLFNVMCATFSDVYTHEVHEEYPKCWQRDSEMVALEKWASHAHTFLIGFGGMGLVGAGTYVYCVVVQSSANFGVVC